jgi:hypothetical protein
MLCSELLGITPPSSILPAAGAPPSAVAELEVVKNGLGSTKMYELLNRKEQCDRVGSSR